MRRFRAVAALVVLPGALGLATSTPASAEERREIERPAVASRPASRVSLRAGAFHGHSYVAPMRRSLQRHDRATFRINYHGFTPAARDAFRRAANLWAPLVHSDVPITIDARFEPLGSSVLGSANASLAWRDFAGAPRRNTWYVDAVANKRARRQLHPSPDIRARFNSTLSSWYFRRDGKTPRGRYDFVSVAMHELGHGLGFMGAADVLRSGGTVRMSGVPTGYDRFTETRRTALLSLRDRSPALAKALQSNHVYFDSARVREVTNGHRARLFAPDRWQKGSSYCHLDEAVYNAGAPSSLMTPRIGTGEAAHAPGRLALAILDAAGW